MFGFGKQKNEFSCINLNQNLFLDYSDNIRTCPKCESGIIRKKFDGLWLDVAGLNSEREKILSQAKDNNGFEFCKDCEFFNTGKKKLEKELKTLTLSHWKKCILHCSYCKNVTDAEINHYGITPVIEQLTDAKLVTKNTKIIFECGEPTMHPEFDKLIYYFLNFESKNIEIHSNALNYRDSLADGIGRNTVTLVVNLDCGNNNVYRFIKKEDNLMDIAVGNIKRYMQYQIPGEKKIISKFHLIPGANDAKKEITDWFILSQDLGIKKLMLDIPDDAFLSFKKELPEYIKEIIVFIKQISDLNDIELIFCDKVKVLYSLIENPKKYMVR